MPKFVNLSAFLQKLISKEHVVVIMEFPDYVQVKMKILYFHAFFQNYGSVLTRFDFWNQKTRSLETDRVNGP